MPSENAKIQKASRFYEETIVVIASRRKTRSNISKKNFDTLYFNIIFKNSLKPTTLIHEYFSLFIMFSYISEARDIYISPGYTVSWWWLE